jgi:hypothetical protein
MITERLPVILSIIYDLSVISYSESSSIYALPSNYFDEKRGGASPMRGKINGKAQPFRTSGGKAAKFIKLRKMSE